MIQKGAKMLLIQELTHEQTSFIQEAAGLLAEAFPGAYGNSAENEMEQILETDRIALVAIHENHVVGLIGAIPQYGTTGWELHPLVVHNNMRNQHIGKALVAALEEEIVKQGGITIYLGTDDENNRTSLYGSNLYHKTYEKIRAIQNVEKHPYSFYEKAGYKIVGIIPDANGLGKPDIIMSKKVNYKIRQLDKPDLSTAIDLIWRVFSEFEAPDYSNEGINEFKKFIQLENISNAIEKSEIKLWGCFDCQNIVGIITIRKPCHISLLFVDKNYHRKGIARSLLHTLIEDGSVTKDHLEITVNSSPYAVKIYRQLGFLPTKAEQLVNGIRFVPMIRKCSHP